MTRTVVSGLIQCSNPLNDENATVKQISDAMTESERELLARYVAAFEKYDIDLLSYCTHPSSPACLNTTRSWMLATSPSPAPAPP